MAEINTASTANAGAKAGVRKSKKLSTKIDLTPMVDLGFLLITFFMINVHMTKPVAADLNMPADSPDSSQICESCALTIVTIKDNKVIYYHGNLQTAISAHTIGVTTLSYSNGIGEIIRRKQLELDQTKVKRTELMLIIKPSDESDYGNVVDVFDEVLINQVRRYAMVNLDLGEKSLLREKGFLE